MSASEVHYDNGTSVTALSLNDVLRIERARSSTLAEGLVSLFAQGGWSAQGTLAGSRYTAPRVAPGIVRWLFPTLRGEVEVSAGSTAQETFMPTLQLTSAARGHLTERGRGVWGGAGLARSFSGERWRTTYFSEFGFWQRRGRTALAFTIKPNRVRYASAVYDQFFDGEADLNWSRGDFQIAASVNVRVGEVFNGTDAWPQLSLTYPVFRRVDLTLSAGSYAPDVLQSLPGAQYASLAVRLPTGVGRLAFPRRRQPAVGRGPGTQAPGRAAPDTAATDSAPPPPAPGVRELTIEAAPGRGGADDTRVLRVRVAGASRIEVVASFTEWEPIALTRQGAATWEATLRIPSGTHRLNLRIDGGELEVPTNLLRITDDFLGVVAVINVP